MNEILPRLNAQNDVRMPEGMCSSCRDDYFFLTGDYIAQLYTELQRVHKTTTPKLSRLGAHFDFFNWAHVSNNDCDAVP